MAGKQLLLFPLPAGPTVGTSCGGSEREERSSGDPGCVPVPLPSCVPVSAA